MPRPRLCVGVSSALRRAWHGSWPFSRSQHLTRGGFPGPNEQMHVLRMLTYAQRSNTCFCPARSVAATSHRRPQSLERNGRRQKQENVSEWAWPGSLSRRHVLRWPFIETDASQGAGRTISGYDILPRIQGHAHAKPWAWHPASKVARFPAICAAGPLHLDRTRSKFMMKAWDQGTQLRPLLLRASILSLQRRGRPWNLGLTGMN